MTNSVDWWLVNPERWHTHPYTVLWGYLAAAVLTVILAVVFWIKGKRNPWSAFVDDDLHVAFFVLDAKVTVLNGIARVRVAVDAGEVEEVVVGARPRVGQPPLPGGVQMPRVSHRLIIARGAWRMIWNPRSLVRCCQYRRPACAIANLSGGGVEHPASPSAEG